MIVEITFEHDGSSGLVAEGSNLWDAARRLGVRLPAECNGRGECDTCAVAVVRGAELLSPATAAEEKNLSADRRENRERLACQVKLERSGVVVVCPVVLKGSQTDKDSDKRFRNLPFNQKVGALIELEATLIFEAMNTIRHTSRGFVGKLLNLNERKEKQDTNKPK